MVVVTGDPRFTFGPPPADELPEDWAPALDLVRRHLLPLLQDRRPQAGTGGSGRTAGGPPGVEPADGPVRRDG